MNTKTTLHTVSLLALSLLAACSGKEGPADQTGDRVEVRLTVAVPEGTPTLYVSGNLPELGPWDPAGLALEGTGPERTAILEVPRGHTLEYKFTLGSWDREALTLDGTVPPNHTLATDSGTDVAHEIRDFKKDPIEYMSDWEGSGVLGTLVYWPDVASAHLSETRHVEIWLPPGYDDDPSRRYPVIYMSDGQNLFDPRIASTGIDWGIDEAMMAGVEAGTFEPAIVVGAWSTARRGPEYNPWGEADTYARFLVEELIPRVNGEFRTRTGPENTFHMGSSMGGLLSYYLVKEHPDVFGACGCVSTHFPISERVVAEVFDGEVEGADETPYVIREIEDGQRPPAGRRFFFDYGTEGLDAQYGPTHERVRQWFRSSGFREGVDFVVRDYEGADHNEASWRARVGDQLAWLLSGRGPG